MAPGRNRPNVAVLSIHGDGHFLTGFVDRNHHVGVGALAPDENGGNGDDKDEPVETHTTIPTLSVDGIVVRSQVQIMTEHAIHDGASKECLLGGQQALCWAAKANQPAQSVTRLPKSGSCGARPLPDCLPVVCTP